MTSFINVDICIPVWFHMETYSNVLSFCLLNEGLYVYSTLLHKTLHTYYHI